MATYEYKCTECAGVLTLRDRLEGVEEGRWGHVHEEHKTAELMSHATCGPLKRVWNAVTIAWPMRDRGHN